MSAVLEFANVSRSYKRELPVLDNVSFSVGQGEVVGLLGRNGAGKTTLIKIAIGLLYADSGSVRVFGLSPTDDPVAVKKRVGYVAEDQELRGGATIGELISFHRYLFPVWDESLEKNLLDRFGLARKAKIRNLSKGQARQVALICALCHRPELLLFDEPAGGLDPVARREFLEASIHLLNDEGTTILFSSHQMQDVERIGGRVVLLDEHHVTLDRGIDDIRENICIAMVPLASLPDAEMLKQLPGCLRVRKARAEWHVIIEGTPQIVHEKLTAALGHNGVRCTNLPLEELFIELAGSER